MLHAVGACNCQTILYTRDAGAYAHMHMLRPNAPEVEVEIVGMLHDCGDAHNCGDAQCIK